MFRIYLLLLFFLSGCGTSSLYPPKGFYNAEGYQVPDVKNGVFQVQRRFDKSEKIPGRETLSKMYHEKDSPRRFATYEYKGSIWAYAIDNNRAGNLNYCLIDVNCDGLFEKKIPSDTPFGMPACLE